MKARCAWAAFSLASLLFLRVWFELNFLQHQPLHQYFLARAASSADYVAAVAGVVLLAALLLPLMHSLFNQRSSAIAAAAVLLTAWLIGRILYLAAGLSEAVPEILWWRIQDEAGALWFSGATLTTLALASAVLLVVPRIRTLLAGAGPALATALTLVAPFGILMAANAAIHGFQAHDTGAGPAAAAAAPAAHLASPGTPRVIVAVFDELDYRLAFETPPPGLVLRGLQRLRASSLFATQAFPPSNSTAISLPAMLLGERLLHVQVDGWAGLGLYRENGSVVQFKDADTLVQRAVRAGHPVGMLGWYHPYCRLFPMASDCLASTAYGYASSYPASTLVDIVTAQWRQVVPSGRPFAALRFENSAAKFRDMLADRSLDLVFAHFAVPHVPYIYDAELERMTRADRMAPAPRGSVNYFANLLLVDRLIDQTLDTLNASCADCILIVTSDHWWRWSRHHDGRTDRRVPFAVYIGNETGPVALERKFNVEFLAHLVMALLQRELATRADVARWIERNGRPRSPVFAPWMLDEDRMATSHDPVSLPR